MKGDCRGKKTLFLPQSGKIESGWGGELGDRDFDEEQKADQTIKKYRLFLEPDSNILKYFYKKMSKM